MHATMCRYTFGDVLHHMIAAQSKKEATLHIHTPPMCAGALDYALNRAIDTWYNDRACFHGLQKRVMEQDWSWNRPALDYIELYHGAKKT